MPEKPGSPIVIDTASSSDDKQPETEQEQGQTVSSEFTDRGQTITGLAQREPDDELPNYPAGRNSYKEPKAQKPRFRPARRGNRRSG